MHIRAHVPTNEVFSRTTTGTDISVRDEVGSVIFELDGPLALSHLAETLCEEVSSLLEAGRRSFIINLADVPYADSAGIGALIMCRRAIHEAGGNLILVAPHTRIMETLKRMHVDSLFMVCSDERAALCRS